GRTIGRCQGVLARRIQQLMTVLAQKHKEFARLACAGSNFVFFRGQRNRWVPHRGLLQMGGACSSSLYKSTEPPVMSTLSELRSKQLISVLGGPWLADGVAAPEPPGQRVGHDPPGSGVRQTPRRAPPPRRSGACPHSGGALGLPRRPRPAGAYNAPRDR